MTVSSASLALVRGDHVAHIDVGDAVAVREAEVLVADVVHGAQQPSTGHRLHAGVEQRHLPRLAVDWCTSTLSVARVDGDVGHVQEVVGEVLLDHVAAVTEQDDELGDPGGAVDLHDVPQDRPAADLDHRLRTALRFLADPCATTTGEDQRLHDATFARDEDLAERCADRDRRRSRRASSPTGRLIARRPMS